MQRKILKSFILGQLSFFSCLAVDIFISGGGFRNNHGLSFYGEHLKTIIPFALGFILCDLFILRASSMLPEVNSSFTAFIWPIRILAILLIFIVLTPDNLNGLFNVLHNTDSFGLFSFELILSGWFINRWYSSPLSWLLITIQFLAGVVAGLSEFGLSNYLSEGSLIYQLAFSTLLIVTMANIVRSGHKEASYSVSDDFGEE